MRTITQSWLSLSSDGCTKVAPREREHYESLPLSSTQYSALVQTLHVNLICLTAAWTSTYPMTLRLVLRAMPHQEAMMLRRAN